MCGDIRDLSLKWWEEAVCGHCTNVTTRSSTMIATYSTVWFNLTCTTQLQCGSYDSLINITVHKKFTHCRRWRQLTSLFYFIHNWFSTILFISHRLLLSAFYCLYFLIYLLTHSISRVFSTRTWYIIQVCTSLGIHLMGKLLQRMTLTKDNGIAWFTIGVYTCNHILCLKFDVISLLS